MCRDRGWSSRRNFCFSSTGRRKPNTRGKFSLKINLSDGFWFGTLQVFGNNVDENDMESHTTIHQIDLDGALVEEFFIDATSPKAEEKAKKSRKRATAETISEVRITNFFKRELLKTSIIS